MFKSYKFNIKPNKEQTEMLEKHFGACRFIYNWALDKKIKLYTEEDKKISCFDLIRQITPMKKTEEFAWLKDIYIGSLQKSVVNLECAFTRFFKEKKGFPKFKSKNNSRQSYQCVIGCKINQELGLIKLPKIKKEFKLRGFRAFSGKIKTVTILREDSKYFVSILIDDGKDMPVKSHIFKNKAIGIDLGIKDFATLSNGEKIANPRLIKKYEKNLAKHQRRLARKQKGSNRRVKQKIKLAKAYSKTSNARTDFLHKTSTNIIKRFDTICIEDLNVSVMVKNHNLAKAINDCGWGKFREMLNYKADWYGKNILTIGRFEPSSKVCSCCGFVNNDLKLKHRKWQCPECQTVHDRDINAAKNILNFAFQKQNLSPSGRGGEGVELFNYESDEASNLI